MPKKEMPAPTSAKLRYDVLIADEYERDGKIQVNWIRVGVGFPHGNGEGFQIELQALPVNGKLVMKLHKPKAD